MNPKSQLKLSSAAYQLSATVLFSLGLLFAGCAGDTGEASTDSTDNDATTTEISDALAPKTRPDDAITRQLHTVTIVTADLEESTRFYRDGLGLALEGPITEDDDTRKAQAQLWGLPDDLDWEMHLLRRPGVDGTIQIRLIVTDDTSPQIHTSWDPREPGPFSLGFPADTIETWDPEMRDMGFASRNEMEQYQVPRPDGTTYGIHETIFNGPDFNHAVLISRRDGMPQLGPVAADSGRGGPVYSAMIVEDSNSFISFFVDVLGLELRSDREWKSAGTEGALNVPDGTEFRFAILYAHGARFGHLLILEFRGGAGLPSTGVAPRPPNRGLASWTFPVRDLDEVLERIESAGHELVAGPVTLDTQDLGSHRVATVLAPNGFLVELFEAN